MRTTHLPNYAEFILRDKKNMAQIGSAMFSC